MTPESATTNPNSPINWQDSLSRGAFEEALSRLKALDLIGQGQPEARGALERLVGLLEALRAKEYAVARKISLEGISGVLGVDTMGVASALESLEQAERLMRTNAAEAMNALNQAREHPLTRAEAENQLGVLTVLNGQSEKGRSHFMASLAADSRHYRAITNLGNLELEDGKPDVAEARYREALQLNSEYSTAYNNLAAALRRQGKRSESVAALKRSQRLAMRAATRPSPLSGEPATQNSRRWADLWDNQYFRIGFIVVSAIILYIIFRR